MNTSSQLSYLFVRKGFVRFIASLMLSTLILFGVVGPYSAYACTYVDVTVHSTNSSQTNYVLLRYQGTDGTTKFSACQSVAAYQWQDLNVQAALGQNMNLNYYTDGSCSMNSEFLAVTLPVPSQTDVAGCWFNPDNVNTPNWSGCVNSSQTLRWITSGFSPN
jgi:hypothetical protein